LCSFLNPSFTSEKTRTFLLPVKERKISATMKRLPEDVLLIIVNKMAAFGTQDLFRFQVTSTYHQKLASKKAVLRALPSDCFWYIYVYWPCAGKQKFMQQISRSGHEAYYVVAAQML
jgi:hypothetical protein